MNKMLASNKTFLMVFTLLATLAGAAQAQVVQSIYMQEPEGYRPDGFHEFFGSERKKLVALAARNASPGAVLLGLEARDSNIRGRKVVRQDAHADVLFGPSGLRDDTFLLDSVSCTLNRYQWNCGPANTRKYVYVGERKALVSFDGDVTPEIAKMIARHEDSSCPLPRIEKEQIGNRDVLLSSHRIQFDKKTGLYDRRGENCGIRFRTRDDKIVPEGNYSFTS